MCDQSASVQISSLILTYRWGGTFTLVSYVCHGTASPYTTGPINIRTSPGLLLRSSKPLHFFFFDNQIN